MRNAVNKKSRNNKNEWKNAPAKTKYKVTLTDFEKALFKFRLKSSFQRITVKSIENTQGFFGYFKCVKMWKAYISTGIEGRT